MTQCESNDASIHYLNFEDVWCSLAQIHIEILEIKNEHMQGVEVQRAMAHLLQSLQDYFTLDEINIDNWTFKLFYKVRLFLDAHNIQQNRPPTYLAFVYA